jgi:glycosyltransferase involved in cell wall biosynthesis
VTRFSLVVPHLNSGPALERALTSILGQTAVDLQTILVDGGSTDESRDTIERHRASIDIVIIEPDQGYADALNKGFARADGEVFGWLPADDELLPGALAAVAEVFEADPGCEVVTGACERVFEDGTRLVCPPDPDAWGKIHIQNVIEQTATFWRRELHRKVGPLDHRRFPYIADWDLWVRMREARARLRTTDRVLSRYHFTPLNQTSRAGRRFADEAFRLLRLRGPLGGLLAYVYRLLYHHFDLKGCYDRPPTCAPARGRLFVWVLRTLKVAIGPRLVNMYNWHFAACQERGLKWW